MSVPPDWKNRLYFGDNLDVLREHIADESVDLVYLDPPFNSNASYNVLFQEKGGLQSSAQITAFDDTWSWGDEADRAYHHLVTQGAGTLPDLMQALFKFLGQSNMMAYLSMMAVRLAELHRVLKSTGSIYLHCDPTASHYLKLLMDAIFSPAGFRTEIIWKRSSAHSDTKQGRKQHGRIHDTVLFYTKGDEWTWNPQHTPYDQDYIQTFYSNVEPGTGRRFQYGDLTGPGGAAKGNPRYEFLGVERYWRYSRESMERLYQEGRIDFRPNGKVPRLKRYLDEAPGIPLQSVWTDIRPLSNFGKEGLGYPTQKPEALLERIIRSSSNEGDIVLDPFCGCGTAVAVAERLHRHWVGIDVTYLAIDLIQRRLQDSFQSDLAPFEVEGIPRDVTSAEALALKDRHQFENWALGVVDAHSAHDKKKGADSGMDGVITFFDDGSSQAKRVIISVKSGHVNVSYVRDLKGVLEREKATIGALITLKPPTKPMLDEAAKSGHYEPEHFPGHRYPRLQILTVEEMLQGFRILYPGMAPVTFKKAPKQQKAGEKQAALL